MTASIAECDPIGTIWVIDDEELCRFLMKSLLEDAGYLVKSFHDSTEFLANFDAKERGCIVVDYLMQPISGDKLIKEVRKQGCPTPFVVVTGYGTVPLAVEFMRMGAVTVLEKPYQQKDLLNHVKLAVESDTRNRELKSKRSAVVSRISRLTARELEILNAVREGKSSKQIAVKLNIRPKTVEVHRSNILRKLEVESMIALIRLLLEQDHVAETP